MNFVKESRNVQNMNAHGSGKVDSEGFRSLLLMDELEGGTPISQREIAGRLGVAVGLVNAYLKTLVNKGFVVVKAYPRNRYAYLLTPAGFVEKSRLACEQFTHYHKLFRLMRQDSLKLFLHLRQEGVREVAFCGLDEFTEVAYLSLCEARLGLVAMIDDDRAGEQFLGHSVVSLSEGVSAGGAPVVLTSLRQNERYRETLSRLGVGAEKVFGPIFGEAAFG